MHPNAEWLTELDDRFDAGDIEGYFAGFTDDVVVHVAGKSSIGGLARGKEAMSQVFARFSERSGEMRFQRHAVFADDSHGVLLWRVSLARKDASFEGTETMVVHISGGMITEAWIDFEDRYEFDEFIA